MQLQLSQAHQPSTQAPTGLALRLHVSSRTTWPLGESLRPFSTRTEQLTSGICRSLSEATSTGQKLRRVRKGLSGTAFAMVGYDRSNGIRRDFPLPGNGIKCQDWVVEFNLNLLKEKSHERDYTSWRRSGKTRHPGSRRRYIGQAGHPVSLECH